MIYGCRHWRLFCQLANTWTFFLALSLIASTAARFVLNCPHVTHRHANI
jgi:hypothetical protein